MALTTILRSSDILQYVYRSRLRTMFSPLYLLRQFVLHFHQIFLSHNGVPEYMGVGTIFFARDVSRIFDGANTKLKMEIDQLVVVKVFNVIVCIKQCSI